MSDEVVEKTACPFAGKPECPRAKKAKGGHELEAELLDLTIKEKKLELLTKLLEESK